jgi:hypothetical protein
MKRDLRKRISFGQDIGLCEADAWTLAELASPEAIQDFISALSINQEHDGDTCQSVVQTLKHKRAHCIEGGFVAAAALWMGGVPPLLMDMQASGDDDHVITLFRSHGCWGAISKSNHVWLRWRDPVYRTLRELAMSYFHEYVNEHKKTLRTYSASFDLRRFRPEDWVTNPGDCWDIGAALDESRHYRLLTPAQSRALKPRDTMEIKAGKLLEYRA